MSPFDSFFYFLSALIPAVAAIRGWIFSGRAAALRRLHSDEFGRVPMNIQLSNTSSFFEGVGKQKNEWFPWQWAICSSPNYWEARTGMARLLNFYWSCMKQLGRCDYPIPQLHSVVPVILTDSAFITKVGAVDDWTHVDDWNY